MIFDVQYKHAKIFIKFINMYIQKVQISTVSSVEHLFLIRLTHFQFRQNSFLDFAHSFSDSCSQISLLFGIEIIFDAPLSKLFQNLFCGFAWIVVVKSKK